ncbi:MAG: sugar ABC transporter permease [Candidatus Rokuibacteriota bacterium]|nr:MAG: sugar ABC transporter permease [Candidatus Rokubacteria bacterium]
MASRQQRRDRLIFLVPSMTVLAVILVYPLAYSLGLSFYNYYLPVPRTTFVGLENFRFILADDAFWEALGVTARFTGAAVAIEVVLGIAVALLLDARIPCRRFVNTVVLLPMAITPAVAGLLMRWMFESNWGLVNYFLGLAGVRGPGWTGDPAWALWSIILADVWQNTPFVILVVYAGLQSVPVEPLEAAMVDGASRAQTLAHVVFPFLRPLVLFVLIIRSMDAFRIFDQVFVMTGGGPGTTTQTITFYNYVMAFRQLRMGRASALGVITLLILSLVIGAWIYLLYRREKGEW